MEELNKEQSDWLLIYTMYTILYLNDTACFAIQQLSKDVLSMDKESKKIYSALIKRAKAYDHKMVEIIDNSMDSFCNYCSEMDKICDCAYFEFKDALKKAYQDAGIEDYEQMSKIEIMRSIVEISVVAGNRVIDNVKWKIKHADKLSSYILEDMLRVANNFSNWAYRKVPKDIKLDFNKDSNVMQKFSTLSHCLIDYNSFSKAYKNALEMCK